MVLRMFQRISSPFFLLISQFQEPLYVLSVVAMPVRGEKVSKQALQKKPDRSS